MPRIVFTHVDEAPNSAGPAAGAIDGEGQSVAVVAGPDRPLHLWRHRLEPGARISWRGPGPERAIYVRSGRGETAGQSLGAGAGMILACGANADLKAGEQGASLFEFFKPGPPPRDTALATAVHFFDSAAPDGFQADTGMLSAVLSKGTWPTCTAWLHRTDYPEGFDGTPHMHTDDEIIVVIDGQLRVGTRREPAGTVLAIDKGSVYSASAGERGVSFINFRPNPTKYIGLTSAGKGPLVDELDFFAALPAPPPGAAWNLARPSDL